MTFLQPALLFLSFLMVIPLVIHLLGERNYRRFPFPDMRFLQELKSHAMQNIRIRQWFILFLRMLWMLCLVLALARPYLGNSFFLSTRLDPGLIILDESFSMQRSPSNKDLRDELISNFQRWKVLSYDERAGSMDALVDSLDAFMRSLGNQRSDILLFSDLQKNKDNERILENVRSIAGGSGLYLLRAYSSEQNAAIPSVGLEQVVHNGEEQYRLSVHIDADSSYETFYSAFFNIDNEIQSRITFNGTSYGDYYFRMPDNGDWLSASVNIEGDSFPGDDRRYFTLPPNRPKKILLLKGAGQNSYLEPALRSASRISLESIESADLASVALQEYDIIIYEAEERPDSAQEKRLREFSLNSPLLYIPWSANRRNTIFTDIIGKLEYTAGSGGEQFQSIDHIDDAYLFPGFTPASIQIPGHFKSSIQHIEPIWTLSSGDDLLFRIRDLELFVLLSPFRFDSNLLGLDPRFITALKSLFNNMLKHEQGDISPGDPIISDRNTNFRVTRPDGIIENAEVRYDNTDLPGVYHIEENRRRWAIAVNIAPGECRQASLNTPVEGYQHFQAQPGISEKIRQQLQGRNAAPLFILLALIFFTAELLLLALNRKGLF